MFIALVLRSFVAQAVVIPSESMLPALQVGDRMFIDMFSFGLHVPLTDLRIGQGWAPERGEIVIFDDPKRPERYLVKRVIGLGGDRVAVRSGRVYIDGRALERSREPGRCRVRLQRDDAAWVAERCRAYLEHNGARHYTVLQLASADGSSRDFGPVVVPPDHVFVMGDNRDFSSDSRVWGFVPIRLLRGRPRAIFWSRRPWGRLDWHRLLTRPD